MEIRSLKSPSTLNALPSFPIRRDLIATGFTNARFFTFSEPRYKTLATASKLKIITAPLSGASGESRSVSVAAGASDGDTYETDDSVVFVAGATGKVGSRTVRELLKLGFSVRAGVRSKHKAESLVESVKKIQDASSTSMRTKLKNKIVERLELVECDLEKPETIGPALGNAAVVICCIGASEKEVFDISGPYRIDYLATKNLVDAAAVAKVKHFIMVSSLGTNKIGFPAAILNLFWGVLLWKRKAEEALIASGIPYTIVRPGGMERPTDAYKETHNITLSEEDTLFGGQVSNLQVAELMAFMAKNRRLSYCKVVEVIAKTSAPLRPMDELLQKIPYQRVPPKELDVTIGTSPQQPKQSGPELARDLKEAGNATTLDSSRESQAEPVQASATATRPLSPFTSYEDLKPPVPPSPSRFPDAPTAVKAPPEDPGLPIDDKPVLSDTLSPKAELVNAPGLPDTNATDVAIATNDQTSISRPLSPYTAYEDLKPPSSPSPIPTGKDVTQTASLQTLTDLSGSASATEQASPLLPNGSSIAGQNASEQEAPLFINEDFKTSPSPSPISAAKDGLSQNPGQPAQEVPISKPKLRPLSPFTMYEDLKPPSSPIPTPGKL